VKTRLAADLKDAIEAIIYVDGQTVAEAIRRFDSNCIQVAEASRHHPSFHAPNPDDALTRIMNAAIPRLLDRGLIHCEYDSHQCRYAYHWTYLGRMFVRENWPNEIPEWIQRIDSESPVAGYVLRPI
jgi:hypothetical protein